jgi:RimJ/RimL family protein N-acetyltransferase
MPMADNISKFQIRFAQDGDHDAIYALLGGDKTGIPVTDPRHPLSTTDAILKASHDANSQSRCWLAICGDKAVGIVTTRDFGGGIFVDDDYRRRGIAGALVSARENFMTDTMGKNEALVPLRADNQASIDLHKKLGYEFDEESKRKLAENPAGDIILHMTKKLADTEPPAVSRYVAPPETAETGKDIKSMTDNISKFHGVESGKEISVPYIAPVDMPLHTYDPNWEANHERISAELNALNALNADPEKRDSAAAFAKMHQMHDAFFSQFRTTRDYANFIVESNSRSNPDFGRFDISDNDTVESIRKKYNDSISTKNHFDYVTQNELPVGTPDGVHGFGKEPSQGYQRHEFVIKGVNTTNAPLGVQPFSANVVIDAGKHDAHVSFTSNEHLGGSAINSADSLATALYNFELKDKYALDNIHFHLHHPAGERVQEMFFTTKSEWRDGEVKLLRVKHHDHVPSAVKDAQFITSPYVVGSVAPPETAESPSTNKAGLLNKAGKVQGAADVALSLAEGHYGDAAVSTTQQVAMNETTWKAVAETGKDIAAVSKVAGQLAKKIPVIGAVVTAGYVAYEVGSDTYQGEYGRAGSAFVAGAAEAGGNLVGLGVGDAAREGVRETIHHTAGEKYMPDESGLRSLGAKTMDMASKFFSKSAKEKPVEPQVIQHTANNKNSEMKL